MKNAKVGEAAGKMFSDTYTLLSQADLSQPEGDAKSTPRPASSGTALKKAAVKRTPSNSILPNAPSLAEVAAPVAPQVAESLN